MIYRDVANLDANAISVIDGQNKTWIGKDIRVGTQLLLAIANNGITNRIYVANFRDNSVSVIDGQTNTKIGKDIPVGKSPSAIVVDRNTNTIYVANSDDNTVCV